MKNIIVALRKPRWFTSDKLKAEHSIFQWSAIEDNAYSLSILGALNGMLPKLPGNPVLVVELEEKDDEPNGKIYFKRKWW